MSLDRKRFFLAASVLAMFAALPQMPARAEDAPSRPAKEARKKARAKAAPEAEGARLTRSLGALVPDGVHFFASVRMTPARTRLLKPYSETVRFGVRSRSF